MPQHIWSHKLFDFVTYPSGGGIHFSSPWFWAGSWMLWPIEYAGINNRVCVFQDGSWKAMHSPFCLYFSWQVTSLIALRPPYCEGSRKPVGAPVNSPSLWVDKAKQGNDQGKGGLQRIPTLSHMSLFSSSQLRSQVLEQKEDISEPYPNSWPTVSVSIAKLLLF